MLIFVGIFLVGLVKGQQVIPPDDFLLFKPVYGASAIKTFGNFTDIVFYIFSGNSISDSFQSNIHKVSINFKKSVPFITSQASKSKSYPKDRGFYGMFEANNFIYIFGGIGKEQVYNDFWRYDVLEDNWKEIFQDDLRFEQFTPRYNFAHTFFQYGNFTYFLILGGMGQEKSALDDCKIVKVDKNNVLSHERCDKFIDCTNFALSGAQVKYHDGKVYLFSGISSEGSETRYFTGLCILDLNSNKTWERQPTQKDLIPSQNGGSLLYNNSLYYFLGLTKSCNDQGYVEDLYSLNLSSPASGWTSSKLLINHPTESFAYIQTTDKVIVFSGISPKGLLTSSSTISFDKLTVSSFEYRSPAKRIGSSLSRTSTNLLLFGGQGELFTHNSIWNYFVTQNGTASKWNKTQSVQIAPEPRSQHAAAAQGDYILIAGGKKENEQFLNDFWLFDLRYGNWTELVPEKNSERPSGFIWACVSLKVPYFYLLGGLNNQRILSNEVWRYDLTMNSMQKMKTLDNKFPYLYDFGCKYEKSKEKVNGKKHSKQEIIIYFGKKDNIGVLDCRVGRLELRGEKYKFSFLQNPDPSMQCRGSASYHYEKNSLVVVGGKGRQGNGFNDIWLLKLNSTHITTQQKTLYELDRTIHSAYFESFNRFLYIMSGFSMNGILLPSSSSDLIYKISLNDLLDSDLCDMGYEKIEGVCRPCPMGSFASKAGGKCEKCEPAGTLTTTEGATAGIQCLTKRDIMPDGFKDHIEKYLGFNSSDINQAPIYQPPNIDYFYYLYAGFMMILLIAFVLLYKFSERFYVFFNKKNMLRSRKYKDNKLLEAPLLEKRSSVTIREFAKKTIEATASKKEEKLSKRIKRTINNEFKLKESFGGFLTGMLLISMIGIVIYLVFDYTVYNIKEKSELIPTATYKSQFTNFYNNLSIDLVIYPFNYGNCSVDILSSADLNFDIKEETIISFTNSQRQKSFGCHLKLEVNKKDLYESDHLQITFKRKNFYAKNIFIWVESQSSKPGYISRYAQEVKSDPERSLAGSKPTVFKFLLVPAYYSEESYFLSTFNKSGTIVHTDSAPILGSFVQDHHLTVGSNLGVRIDLVGSESCMITSVYLQIGLVKFISILLTQVVGLFGIYGGFYVFVQMVLKKIKKNQTRRSHSKSKSVDYSNQG